MLTEPKLTPQVFGITRHIDIKKKGVMSAFWGFGDIGRSVFLGLFELPGC